MDNFIIIDETAPFTLEDYKKVVAQIKRRDWLYQELLEPIEATANGVSSAICDWYTRRKEMHDQP